MRALGLVEHGKGYYAIDYCKKSPDIPGYVGKGLYLLTHR